MTLNNWHTKYFRNLEQVEEIFNQPLQGEQQEMILTYLVTGTRPFNSGCWTCNAGAMRILTGAIDRFEQAVDLGVETWPFPIP